MAKRFDFYDVSHLLKDYPDAMYYMVIGERSNGKTYSALNYALKRYFETGEQFAYIRRFQEDVRKKNLSNLLSGHVENGVISKYSGGKFVNVDYSSNKFWPFQLTEEEKMDKAHEPCGFAFDLNSMEHYKSISFPRVTTIIFDEFLSRQGYLTNEFVLFMNCLSTIIRHRDNVKIFMLGNTVNQYCPYFGEMGLTHVKDQKQGTVDIYTYSDTELKVAVEYCSSSSRKGGKSSDVYFAFDNPELHMITSGTWEIGIYPHLEKKYRPKDVSMVFFIQFQDKLLQCELVNTEQDYYMFVHPKTSDIKNTDSDIVYTVQPNQKWNYRVGIGRQRDRLSAYIMSLFTENRVFYSDNETGEVVRNFMMVSANIGG